LRLGVKPLFFHSSLRRKRSQKITNPIITLVRDPISSAHPEPVEGRTICRYRARRNGSGSWSGGGEDAHLPLLESKVASASNRSAFPKIASSEGCSILALLRIAAVRRADI
jgi:hypothetical protein